MLRYCVKKAKRYILLKSFGYLRLLPYHFSLIKLASKIPNVTSTKGFIKYSWGRMHDAVVSTSPRLNPSYAGLAS